MIRHPETHHLLIVGQRNGSWSLPGGAREVGETLEEAAIRETQEEAGISVAIERLVSVNERRSKPHVVFFIFTATIMDGTPHVTDDDEIDRVEWVDAAEANRRLVYWPIDLQTLHQREGAFYFQGQWE